jgi:hypothetical protein
MLQEHHDIRHASCTLNKGHATQPAAAAAAAGCHGQGCQMLLPRHGAILAAWCVTCSCVLHGKSLQQFSGLVACPDAVIRDVQASSKGEHVVQDAAKQSTAPSSPPIDSWAMHSPCDSCCRSTQQHWPCSGQANTMQQPGVAPTRASSQQI